jgi:hypothetical protein
VDSWMQRNSRRRLQTTTAGHREAAALQQTSAGHREAAALQQTTSAAGGADPLEQRRRKARSVRPDEADGWTLDSTGREWRTAGGRDWQTAGERAAWRRLDGRTDWTCTGGLATPGVSAAAQEGLSARRLQPGPNA